MLQLARLVVFSPSFANLNLIRFVILTFGKLLVELKGRFGESGIVNKK